MEIGPRDVKNSQVVAVRRDIRSKDSLPISGLSEHIPSILEDIQQNLFNQALKFQQDNTYRASNYEEFKSIIENKRGFVKAFWCGDTDCEDRIKEETMATIRVMDLDESNEVLRRPSEPCVLCGKKSTLLATFARAY